MKASRHRPFSGGALRAVARHVDPRSPRRARPTFTLVADCVRLYGRHFKAFIAVSLLTLAPLAIPAPFDWLAKGNPPASPILWFLPIALFLLGAVQGTAAISYLTWQFSTDQPVTPRLLASRVLDNFWSVARLTVLTAGISLGLFVVALPAVLPIGNWFDDGVRHMTALALGHGPAAEQATYWLKREFETVGLVTLLLMPTGLAVPALVVEANLSAVAALKRSLRLVRGAWWRIGVGFITILAVIYWMPEDLTAMAIALTARTPGSTPGQPYEYSPLVGMVWLAAQVLLWPFAGIGLTRLYAERVSRVSG
jgi:hypothetical protein